MIDTTILIDQSYFLQDNENVKTPEEKAQDFIKEFTKATKESELLNSLPEETKDEVLSEFLFISLSLYQTDTSQLPTKEKLDRFILRGGLNMNQEEIEEAEIEIEIPQGPEEVDEDFEDDFENSGDSGDSGEPINLEGSSDGNDGVTRITVENPREIQDGESITIRRDRSNTTNRFF